MPLFEAVVLAAVLLNTIALLLEHSNMSDDFALGLWYANMAFLCIFAVEFLLKKRAFLTAGKII